MTDNKKTAGINPVGAGVIGVAIGAVGSAAAIALSDKKTRTLMGKKLGEFTKHASQRVDDMKSTLSHKAADMEKKASKIKKDAQKTMKETADKVQQTKAHAAM